MFQKSFLRSLAIVALGTLISVGVASPVKSGETVWLRLDAARDNMSQAQIRVRDFGRVVRKDTQRGAYEVRLRPGLNLLKVLVHLRKQRGVADVNADPEAIIACGVDRRSRLAMDFFIRAKMELHEEKRENDPTERAKEREEFLARLAGKRPYVPTVESEAEEIGVDYIESYRKYVHDRAFPNDSIAVQPYREAVAIRDAMPPARIGEVGRGLDPLAKWEFTGPRNLDIPYTIYYGVPPLSGRVSAIAYHPTNTQIIYIAGATGGVFRSTNGGTSWTALGDGLPTLAVSSIAIDPKNGNNVYIGGGDAHGGNQPFNFGIMKSTNGGTSWTKLTLPDIDTAPISDIIVDPDDSNIVTACTGGPPAFWGNVYRSTNAGATWTRVTNGETIFQSLSVGEKDGAGNRVYYAAAGGFPESIWRSTDRGATWTKLNHPTGSSQLGYAALVAASKVSASTVYVLLPSKQAIFKSTNNGTNWTDITNNYPNGSPVGAGYNWSQHYYNYSLETAKIGGNDLVLCGNVDLAVSVNGGTSWRTVGGPTYTNSAVLHNDQHTLTVNPTAQNEALVGCDGGLYKFVYTAATDTFTIAPQGNGAIPITQFYTGAWHPTNAAVAIGGTQDNASPAARGSLTNWNNVGGGDGAGALINPSNPNVQYASVQYYTVYQTTDGWTGWTSGTGQNAFNVSPPMSGTDRVPFIGKLWMDPTNNDLVYAGSQYLYRLNGNTGVWTSRLGNKDLAPDNPSTGGNDPGQINVVAVAKGDSNRIYVGTDNGLLWMSTDGGANYTNLSSGLPVAPVLALSVNPANPSDLLVGYGGTGNAHLYRCTNTTAASRTWTAVAGSGSAKLPDVALNTIARDPWQSSTWYVGTDVGVFVSNDSGGSWTNATQPLGLPNVQVSSLEAVKGTGYLNAATFGRGMWRIKIKDTSASSDPTVTALTIDPTTIEAGGTATGTVTLSAAPAASFSVNLSATTGATVPATLTFSAGQSSKTFTITGSQVQTNTTSTIKASTTAPASEKSATVTVQATTRAQFVSQTVPSTVNPGQAFNVTVTFKNTGSVAWTEVALFRLASINPAENTTWGLKRVNLAAGDTITNGQSKSFTFSATAPMTPGTYNFQWRMVKDTATPSYFGDNSTNVAITVSNPLPGYDASFSSQVVPLTVPRGATFRVSMLMRNMGAESWTQAKGVVLASQNPANNTRWRFSKISLNSGANITTGTLRTFAGWPSAPTTNGTYDFQWQMQKDGIFFGAPTNNLKIQVVDPWLNAAFVSQTVPTTVTRGQKFQVTITMKNTGTTTWTTTEKIKLGSQLPQDNTVWGLLRVTLAAADSIATNGTKTFTFNVTAPATPGTYPFQWKMTQEGKYWFGAPSSRVDIVVQ